jgi:hypothetical protein
MNGKRFVLGTQAVCGAAALVVSGMSRPAHAANLLINPGFEAPATNINPNSTVTAWTLHDSMLRANYQNHTPGGQWMIWEQTFQTDGDVFQDVPNVTAGTNYTLSAFYYFEANYPTTGATSNMNLIWFGPGTPGGGATQLGENTMAILPNTVTTGSWNQYTFANQTAPAGAVQVVVDFGFTSTPQSGGALGGFVDDADLEGAGIPPNTAQWAVNGSGDWNLQGDWTTGSVPNGVGVEADFFNIPTQGTTVFTNTAVTAGILHFNNTSAYQLTGLGSLTLQAAGTTSAQVEVDQNVAELNLPVTIASNTTFNIAPGAELLVANPITINSGKALTQTGGGSVIYQSIITVQSAASIAFDQTTHAHMLSVAATGNASIASTSGNTVLTLDSLSNSGTLNIANNELVINYGGPGGSGSDPVVSIRSQLTTGYNGGAWNGPGIDSTSAAAHAGYALGYADAADPGNPAGIASGTLEVLYTLQGDADLNRTVNGIDFGILAANFNKTVTAWDQGDFDYNNIVNGIDFTALAANFNKAASGAAAGASAADFAALDAFAAANGLLADVPEPATLGLLAVAAATTLSRRRRRGTD